MKMAGSLDDSSETTMQGAIARSWNDFQKKCDEVFICFTRFRTAIMQNRDNMKQFMDMVHARSQSGVPHPQRFPADLPSSVVRSKRIIGDYFCAQITSLAPFIAVLEADECPLNPEDREELKQLYSEFVTEFEKQFDASKARE